MDIEKLKLVTGDRPPPARADRPRLLWLALGVSIFWIGFFVVYHDQLFRRPAAEQHVLLVTRQVPDRRVTYISYYLPDFFARFRSAPAVISPDAEASCALANEQRFDCDPGRNSSQAECAAIGCCWDPAAARAAQGAICKREEIWKSRFHFHLPQVYMRLTFHRFHAK